MVKKENSLTLTKYNLQGEENKANQKAIIAGDIAKTQEKLQLEDLRVQLSSKKQEAETIIPANAKNIHRAIHALGVTFPQPLPLYFHNMGKIAGAME